MSEPTPCRSSAIRGRCTCRQLHSAHFRMHGWAQRLPQVYSTMFGSNSTRIPLANTPAIAANLLAPGTNGPQFKLVKYFWGCRQPQKPLLLATSHRTCLFPRFCRTSRLPPSMEVSCFGLNFLTMAIVQLLSLTLCVHFIYGKINEHLFSEASQIKLNEI